MDKKFNILNFLEIGRQPNLKNAILNDKNVLENYINL
jgi:hypothetical protein